MNKKFMCVKKIAFSILTVLIITSQLMGCASVSSKEMLDAINNGSMVEIEVTVPDSLKGNSDAVSKALIWIPLDQQDTYTTFRLQWEDLLHIIPYGNGSKNGVWYINETGGQDGNSTMRNSFRNRVFIENYWNNPSVLGEMATSVREAYADASASEQEAILQGLNGYFGILPDYEPNYANMNEMLSRGQFLAGVFRAENPVQDTFEASADGTEAFGDTEYTAYVEEMEEAGYSYLDTSDNSLNEQSVSGKISRAEAIYTIVQMHFKQEYNAVDGLKDKAYDDCANAGDIAGKQGFIERDKKAGTENAKRYWKAYELEYALENADRGMPESLYRAMVVAKEIGLIEGADSRWDEAITKGELIELLINTYQAENKRDGYLINAEYGEGEEAALPGGGTGLKDTGNSGGGQVGGLADIFSPSKYLDTKTWIVTKTQEQRDILQAYDITEETHYVDELINILVADIFNIEYERGEGTATDEEIIELIQGLGQELKKALTQEDWKQMEAELQALHDIEAMANGGYKDENGNWVTAEEHWAKTGRGPGGEELNADGSREVLEQETIIYDVEPVTVYAIDSVNIRTMPSKDGEKIGSLSWGEAITVNGVTEDESWVRFEYNGQQAFVSNSYLSAVKPEKPVQSQPSGGSGTVTEETGGSSGGDDGWDLPGWDFNGGNGAGWDPSWMEEEHGGFQSN